MSWKSTMRPVKVIAPLSNDSKLRLNTKMRKHRHRKRKRNGPGRGENGTMESDGGAMARSNVAIHQAEVVTKTLADMIDKVEDFQLRTDESFKANRALKELDRLSLKAHGIGTLAREARRLMQSGDAEELAHIKLDLAENRLELLLELVNLLEVVGN